MKSKLSVLVMLISVVLLTAACGTNTLNIEGDTATAKTGSNSSAEPVSAESSSPSTEPETPKEEDIWTYYNDATWEGDFKGLKVKIAKVVVSDKAPNLEQEEVFDQSAVGVKFYIENTTTDMFTTYPDQAVLVTSTGEQLDPEMFLSDSIGGEIEEGVIKEGNVIWYLERGHAEEIEWVKLKWNAYFEDDYSDSQEFEVKLQLKP